MNHGFMSDMSRTELLAMREKGMTNREIANALSCSNSTIYNLIGAMPKELRRSAMSYAPRKAVESTMTCKKPDEAGSNEACLNVTRKEIALTGAVKRYLIDPEEKTISVCSQDGDVEMILTTEELSGFVKEIQAIIRNIDKCQPVLEMW